MRLAGRVQAAIEILTEISTRHRPANEALKDWGKAHRFAGSSDRHAIGTLVYDGLRNRRSAAHAAGDDTPRAILLGVLKSVWKLSADEIVTLAQEPHGPGALTTDEAKILSSAPALAPLAVAADLPDWLMPSYVKNFGDDALAQAQALARRAPIDLRVNTLKATREKVLESLQRFGVAPGPLSPLAIRIEAPGPDQKHVNVEAEPAHGMGWFEVQDAASQIAALMSGAAPGETVADICAGAGGKTLALAAMMQNQGRLVAHDRDRHRLRPIFERITRAGATNIEVLSAEQAGQMKPESFDRIVIDAPCSGTGSWRRKPDAKWKLTQKQLDQRIKDQRDVLHAGAALLRPGGTLTYITCSVLPEENDAQVTAFLAASPMFESVTFAEQWRSVIGTEPPASANGSTSGLTLTPHSHETDGFFMAVMRKLHK
jgi:16S rRNA (cytosine967-C5)-methyltransferase